MFKKSPALFLLIFIVVGILIADSFRIAISYFFISLILFVVASLFCYKSHRENLLVICIGLGLLSFVGLRFASLYYETGSNHISNFIDGKSTYIIYGKISDWPELKLERTELTVDVDSLEGSQINYVRGKVLLKINMPTTAFQRGDNLVFKGRIYAVEGERFSKEFNYNRFLRYKEINGVVFQTTPLHILHDKANRYSVIPFIDKLREAIKESFKRNLSPVSAALASGFLIGETRDIPPELYKRFKDSGTLHLLAVSGSNVILVLTFFSILINPFLLTKKKRSLILMAVVVIFSLLSYGDPSVVRAGIMAGLVLLAGVVERRYELKNIIAVAAFMILIYEPSQLFDLGFQLSFVIAWGLIVVVPKLNLLFKKYNLKKWFKYLLFPFLVSLTAQLFSIGLIGLYFKQIPLLSPIANLFIVPLVSVAVIGVLVLLVADFILPLLGLFVGSFLNLIIEFTVYVVNIFGSDKMPLISVHDWTIAGVCGLYVILFMIPFAIFSKSNRRKLLFVVLLFVNLIAAKHAIAAFESSNSLDLLCFNIPGGNISIVQPKNREVDIIVNSIQGKTYRIDEKIIIPKLKQWNIFKIDKLIVLNTDFSAIDDLLRIAKTYDVREMYITEKNEHSFLDQINNTDKDFLSTKLIILQKGTMPIGESGYLLQDDGFSVIFHGYKITFVDKISSVHLKTFSRGYKQILVLGSTWNISRNDFLVLKDLRYEKIICSKIAHSKSVLDKKDIVLSTDLIVDLNKVSEYIIKISY